MILVTGSGGKTGQAIIKAVSSKKQNIRAFVRSNNHGETVLKLGATEVVVGDLMDEDAFQRATHGVEMIYHICPNVSPHEIEIGDNAISAAKQSGVAHFVYHSVLHPQIEAMPHHWLKMQVEEMIFASGIPFTILQPTAYMQNITGRLEDIKKSGVYSVPYSLDTKISLVDINDVAEVAATILCQAGHEGATYELCSPDKPTQHEIAEMLSAELNETIEAKRISIDEWQESARKSGMGNFQIDTLSKMFAYYEENHLQGNSNVLEMLLSKAPTTLKAVLSKVI